MFTTTRPRNRTVSQEHNQDNAIRVASDFTSIPETPRFFGSASSGAFKAHIEWSKSYFHTVNGLEKLPEKARKLCDECASEGFVSSATFDARADIAAVADRKQILIWKLGQGADSAYLLKFDLPFSSTNPPFLRLLAPKSASRMESYSLLACSPEGKVALWNSLSFHLHNAIQYELPTKIGDTVTSLSEFFSGGFVAGTAFGDIFTIDLQVPGIISAVSLRKRSSVLQRVGSWFAGANSVPLRNLLGTSTSNLIRGRHDEILSIKFDNRANKASQNHVVILSGQSIHTMHVDMPNRSAIVSTVHIFDKIQERLRIDGYITHDDFGIIDFSIERSGKLVMLIAFQDDGVHGYAVVVAANILHRLETDGDMDMDGAEGLPSIVDIIKLDYTDDGNCNTQPMLLLPNGGPVAVVSIKGTVLYRYLFTDLSAEGRIDLNNASKNALLSWRNAKEGPWNNDVEPTTCIQLLTAQAGLLELTVDINKLSTRLTSDSAITLSETNTLLRDILAKSYLEQKVFFDTKPNNPLTFHLDSNQLVYIPALRHAAIEVSREILSGESMFLIPRLDLQEHLNSRVAAMNTLIECCYSVGTEANAGLSIPSQLRRNLETMNSACALWTHIVSGESKDSKVSARIASAAIPDYASNSNVAYDDTRLREFLKSKSNLIPQFIINIATMVSTTGHPLAAEFGQTSFQVEANALVLTILRATQAVRVELTERYPGEDFDIGDSWTVTHDMVQALKSIFFATLPVIPTLPISNGTVSMDYEEEHLPSPQRQLSSTLSSQAAEVADFLLKVAHQRLLFAQRNTSDIKSIQEAQGIASDLQSSVIKAVNDIGQPIVAMRFAEEYQVFDKLIEIIQPTQSSGAMEQADHFSEKYGESFIKLLFDWFIATGHEAELLQLSDNYNDLLSQYLESTKNFQLSWLHDIRLQRYEKAFETLERIAPQEANLHHRKNILSTAKLSLLASVEQTQQTLDGSGGNKSAAIAKIGRQLRIINVQEEVVAEFKQMLSEFSYETTEQKAEALTEMLCTQLTENEWSTLKLIFKHLVSQLLEGKMLTEEGLVDVLTLRDNRTSQSSNYITALKLYENAKTALPAERSLAMLYTIWRRIYINDRWDDLHVFRQTCSDPQLTIQLRQTIAFRVINRCRNYDIVRPSQIQLGPVKWDIKIRFPEIINDSNIEGVAGDLRSEQFELAMFIEKCHLEDFISEILLQVK